MKQIKAKRIIRSCIVIVFVSGLFLYRNDSGNKAKEAIEATESRPENPRPLPQTKTERADSPEPSPQAAPEQEEAVTGYPDLIMVNDILYYDSGEISTDLRCGMMDGQITDVTDGVPDENGQSNFGSGYGYQYGLNGIDVSIDDEWHIFIPYQG